MRGSEESAGGSDLKEIELRVQAVETIASLRVSPEPSSSSPPEPTARPRVRVGLRERHSVNRDCAESLR